MRFTRKDRLNTKADFRQVFSSPSVSRDRYFRVLARANELGRCRLGMAVSKKNCRRAVDRSRLKRTIRESFRLSKDDLDRLGGFDYVVLPMAQAASICNKKLAGSLQDHWHRARGESGTPNH